MKYFLLPLLIAFQPTGGQAQEIREYMDLQIHPTMHITYGFFGKGLEFFDEDKAPKLKYKHQFTNVNYANFYKNNEGARIFVTGALNKEGIRNPKKAKRVILEHLQYINDIAAAHSDDFVVAKTPQEVRDYVHNTNKTIFIHSIEGGRELIHSQEDAQFWADQGVAFITLIHLKDYELGGSAILPGMITNLINLGGAFRKKNERGLTEEGKQVIEWMSNAGIMVDLTHMNDQTRKDVIAFMSSKNIPPIVTHDMYKPIQNHPRGMEAEDILNIYKTGGFVSLPIGGASLKPYKPYPEYKSKIEQLKRYCDGSIDSYKLTYGEVKNLIEDNTATIMGDTELKYSDLNEQQKVNTAIGFQTDFNGWVNHHRPRYGKKGCYEIKPDTTYNPVDLQGLAHPGLLKANWDLLESEGVDLSPILRASEKFLQVWERVLGE